MRAGGKNKQGPRNKHCIMLPHSLQHGRWKEGVLVRNFSGRKKKGLSLWERLPHLYEKRPVNVELGAVDGPLGRQVKPLHTSFPVFQHGRGFSNETRDRSSVKNVCAIWQAHGQFLKQAHFYLTSVKSHNTKHFLIQRFAFGVNALLSSSTIKRRPVKLSTPVSLFSLLSFFLRRTAPLCISWGAENVVRLRFACWPTWVLPVDRAKATVPARTRKLCGGIPRSKSESALFFFFFFGDWRKSMRAHNEKHRKKLAWPNEKFSIENCTCWHEQRWPMPMNTGVGGGGGGELVTLHTNLFWKIPQTQAFFQNQCLHFPDFLL